MSSATIAPEAVLKSLMRVIHPFFGVDVASPGATYCIEPHVSTPDMAMPLITPGCPSYNRTEMRHPDISSIRTHPVWEPAWDTDKIIDAGRRAEGW